VESDNAGCAEAVFEETREAANERARLILEVNDVLMDFKTALDRGGFVDLTRFSIEILRRVGKWPSSAGE